MAKIKPIKTGILGLGRIGWNHHAKLMSQHKNFTVSAVADPLEDRRREAEEEFGCTAHKTLRSMLEKSDAELIVVATRSVDHCKHAIQSLQAGKHVLLEKPAAINVGQMDKIIHAARKARKIVTVHQNHRFSDRALFLKKQIDSGIIGKVFEIRHTNHAFNLRNDWQTLKKNGGGHLFNWGVHSLDMNMFLMGSPVAEIWGDMKHLVAGGDADDYFKVLLRGKNGCLVDVEMSYAANFDGPELVIMGTRGTIVNNKNSATVKYFKPTRAMLAGKADNGVPADRKYGHVIAQINWKEKNYEKIPAQKADFYGNLASAIRKRTKLLITPESVREQLRVISKVRTTSAAKRGDLYKHRP